MYQSVFGQLKNINIPRRRDGISICLIVLANAVYIQVHTHTHAHICIARPISCAASVLFNNVVFGPVYTCVCVHHCVRTHPRTLIRSHSHVVYIYERACVPVREDVFVCISVRVYSHRGRRRRRTDPLKCRRKNLIIDVFMFSV